MNAGRVATRYAKALFEVSLDQKMDQKAYVACQRMARLWYENADLRSVLSERMVPNTSKVEILEILMNSVHIPLATKFFDILAYENRIDIIANIALIYMDIYREYYGIVHAEVESAKNLTSENRKNIRTWLSQKYPNREIEMHVQVNPELIGGIRIDLASTQLDASIAGELTRISKQLYKNRTLRY